MKLRKVAHDFDVAPQPNPEGPAVPDFVPLPVPPAEASPLTPPSTAGEIFIELPSPRGTITVRWPVSEAAQCGHWLKGLLG